ncbi:hypothetical protein J3U99_20770 [Brucella pituitosa]|uniref:hypothetical protein n=1 Tax=Brucella pituitosa TaxID=571256 RepID=UPI002006B79A|nr:hypothetical protein [Brucella pituitosa]MCK4207204.1 hypothetical protein [Brucella pituitosa]
MADLRLRINELPEDDDPALIDFIPIDGPSTRKTSAQALADKTRPLATEVDAIQGVNDTKTMTPLRVKQSVENIGTEKFATAEQGNKADTAVQRDEVGTVSTANFPDVPSGKVLNDKGEWIEAPEVGLFNYDTLAQANADLASIPQNAGVNILNDGTNNGFWVKQGNALIKKSSVTMADIVPQINFATKLAATRGYAYMQKAVGGFHDEYGNFGAALLQNGQFLAQIRGCSLNPNFVDYLAVENPETKERHVIYAIRQKDGFGWVGLRPALDIRVYTDGPQGNCTVWAVADGFSPWQLTPTPGDYRSPIVEGRYIKWIEIAGGVGVEHSVLAVAPVSPLDPSVTEVEHILGNGQSLMTGSYDGVVVHSVAVLHGYAVTFNSGARTLPNHDAAGVNTVIADEDISHLIDLREKNQSVSRALGETICSGASIRMKRIGGINPATGLLWSIHAIGGQSIEDVWQGTVPYSNSLKAVAQGKALVQQAGKAYRCRFSTFMGGESNRQDSKTAYMNKQLSYQAGYKTDINAITGDNDEFMVVMCQMSNWTSFTSTFARSEVPLAQLQVAIDHPTKFACVGPKYFLDTYTDGVHLTGVSEARIGAYYGRALEAIIKGGQWKPLYPTAAVRTGSSVVMTFNVPDGPLVMDTTLVTDPGNFGFEWRDNGDGNAVTISNVAITSANQVTVTLSAVPTGTNGQIGIAATGVIGNHGGPTTGPRSNLRDSSSDIDDQGYPMYNWCCHSLIAVS